MNPAAECLVGSLATCGACLFTNPLETVKTRMQLQGELQVSKIWPARYKSYYWPARHKIYYWPVRHKSYYWPARYKSSTKLRTHFFKEFHYFGFVKIEKQDFARKLIRNFASLYSKIYRHFKSVSPSWLTL